ncbi:hypothetical protein JB92DRAFT_1607544 [Gautieria morchelliformis]|nr:hypothetical protein JB92DRAFT_1607544 [Gautieria morchelliformis]
MPSICSRIPAPCHCTDCRGHLLQIPCTRERHLKADEVNHALERKRQAVARQALRDKPAMRYSPYGRDMASMHVRSSGNARHEASITTIGGFDFEQGQSGKDKPRIGVFDVPASEGDGMDCWSHDMQDTRSESEEAHGSAADSELSSMAGSPRPTVDFFSDDSLSSSFAGDLPAGSDNDDDSARSTHRLSHPYAPYVPRS